MNANPDPRRHFGAKKPDWRWVPPTEQVSLLGDVVGGMLFVGTVMPFRDRWWSGDEVIAPFLINPDLPIAGDSGPEPDFIDSHPSYTLMSPYQRAGYLAWLKDDRRDPRARPAYPLLFLLGLEHRLMAQQSPKAEIGLLLVELRELRAVYGGREAFDIAATRLIHEAEWQFLRGDGPGLSAYRTDLMRTDVQMPLVLKVCVGRMIRGRVPIPFDWAMGAVIYVSADNGGFRKRMGFTRIRQQFLDLARIRFAREMPSDGVRIRDQKHSEIYNHYTPACRHFGGAPDAGKLSTPDSIPNPAYLTWTRMGKFCDKVIDDLTPYAKAVGAEGDKTNTLAALAALPIELHDKPYADPIRPLRERLEGLPRHAHISSFEDLFEDAGQEPSLSVSGANQGAMADLLGVLGWAMEPDPLFCDIKPRGRCAVVIFPRLGDHPMRAPSSPGWTSSVFVVALLVRLAEQRLEDIHPHEISTHFALPLPEIYRLGMLTQWLCLNPPTDADLRKMAKALSPEDAVEVGHAIVAQAARVDLARGPGMAAIEKGFDILSLPRGDLYGAVHRAVPLAGAARDVATAAPATAPVLIEQASPGPIFRIPPPAPGTPVRRQPVPIPLPPPLQVLRPALAPIAMAPRVLDHAVVARIRAETRQVSGMLAAIYEDDPVHVRAPPAPAEVPAVPEVLTPIPGGVAKTAPPEISFPGLDDEHARFLAALCDKSDWPRADFEALAASLGLMAGGAAEVLNDWAFDRFDDAIIEDGDSLTINTALLR